MTPSQFFDPLIGQALLLPGQKEIYRGQCVQSVGLWVEALGLSFPAYSSAYLYYGNGIPGYYQVPNGQINEGDIVIFSSALPGSGGAGHICVAKQDSSPLDFLSYDSNWSPPLKLEQIEHNGGEIEYILGYLRREQMEVMTQSAAEKVVTYLYRLGTGDYPNPGQAEYWVPRVRDVVTGVDELGTAMLGAQTPKPPATYVPYSGPELYVPKP